MITVKIKNNLAFEITNQRDTTIITDVPKDKGGDDLGFDPHDLLEASLGGCTSMTVMMVAKRRNWPLEDVQTKVSITKETDENIILREVHLVGDLTEEQRTKLLEIANKCPIHKFLERKTTVETRLV